MLFDTVSAALLAMPISLLVGLAFTIATDRYIRVEHRRIMLIVVALCFALIIQNAVEDSLHVGVPHYFLRTLFSVLGYIIRPIILVLFISVIKPDSKHIPCWILLGVNAAVYITAFFSPVTFRITEDNLFEQGPLSGFCLYISAVLLAYLFIQTVRSYRTENIRENWIPFFVTGIILLSVFMDYQVVYQKQPLSFLTAAMVIGIMFYYIWLHLQFVHEHESDLMAEQRIRIMMTQIQPHFLYNTIATFKALCKKDPERAADVADKFGMYLRQNLDTLNTADLIPIDRELDHTRIYSDIEMVRFENVRVEYDIKDHAFSVPPLTVQPIVENAIRHGVRIRDEGVVYVSTRSASGFHEIIIRDNGKGFDPDAPYSTDGTHIGIQNVRERIEDMCGGTLTVESEMGKGTAVTIRIPRNDTRGDDAL